MTKRSIGTRKVTVSPIPTNLAWMLKPPRLLQALMKAAQWPESVKQGLTWLSRQKMPNGTRGSTQATILAMRALLAGSATSLGQEFESKITLLLNGEKVETLQINKDNSDVMQQVDLTSHLHAGENRSSCGRSPPVNCHSNSPALIGFPNLLAPPSLPPLIPLQLQIESPI